MKEENTKPKSKAKKWEELYKQISNILVYKFVSGNATTLRNEKVLQRHQEADYYG